MANYKKMGAVSDADRQYIIENVNKQTVEEIAAHINKNVKVVEKEIKNHVKLPTAENSGVRWHLKKSLEWKHLKQEFTVDELNLIEEKYVKYIEQIKDDIVATEESQLLNMIKLEVLIDRNLKSRMKVLESIQVLESARQAMIDGVAGNFTLLSKEDRDRLMDAENQIAASRNIESSRTGQHVELQKQVNDLGTKLKTSRDQRVGKIVDPRFSFPEYVKSLLSRDKQERESRFIQLNKIAVDKEEARLSQAYQFDDGAYDNPILSVEILDKLDNKEQQDIEDKKNVKAT